MKTCRIALASSIAFLSLMLSQPAWAYLTCKGESCSVDWVKHDPPKTNPASVSIKAKIGGNQPGNCAGYNVTGSFSVCACETVWFRVCPQAGGDSVTTYDNDKCPCTGTIIGEATTQHWYLAGAYQGAGLTWSHTFESPGDYEVAWWLNDPYPHPDECANDDPVKKCSVTVTVVAPTLHVTRPNDGDKIGWDVAEGVRTTRRFYAILEATLQPECCVGADCEVRVYWKKADSENSAPMEHVGNGLFRYSLDITERFTKEGSENRYRVRATVTIGECTYQAPEQPYFCILKGLQILQVAEDFKHYPYHYGSKGPDRCSGRKDHGEPADHSYWHQPYDNVHPSHPPYDVWHPCCCDCSGYVLTVYAQVGISVPEGSGGQCSELPEVASPRIGDVLCYGGHVAINDVDGRWHAPQTGDWTKFDPNKGNPTKYVGPSGWGWCMSVNCSH